MKALLVVAHGSRREASNEEVRALTRRVAQLPGLPFRRVEAAFLELAEPSIGAGIERLARAGVREVVVVPYFLSAGRHVSRDIPEALEAARRRHPELRIRLRPHLGSSAALAGLVGGLAAGEG